MGAININHNDGTIITDEDMILQITKNGAIKIGNGTYLSEMGNPQTIGIDRTYEGAIKYNENTGTIQYCDGKSWKDFSYGVEEETGIIWSITF